mgnify:CR=1 FL=1
MCHVIPLEETIYLVDYDMSAPRTKESRRLRRRFYNKLHKLLKDHAFDWSTASVIKIKDYKLARKIYELAKEYGKAHLYEARELV